MISVFVRALMVIYGVALVVLLVPVARHAHSLHQNDTSNWRYLGIATAVAVILARIAFVERRPARAVAIVIGLALAVSVSQAVTELVEEATQELSKTPLWRGGSNPPPELSAIKKMQLLMPAGVGEGAVEGAWPPFWGHRFPLGDRR